MPAPAIAPASAIPFKSADPESGEAGAGGEAGLAEDELDEDDMENSLSLAAIEAELKPKVLESLDIIASEYKRLRRLAGAPGDRLIVVEGIYSMLGDTAPLREIAAVKRETGAYLLVDEAHSLGVLGEKGRGLAEAAGVEADVDFIVGTFSKSLGSVGGFCVSDSPDFDVMRIVCRPYMFTASLPPGVVASTLEALSRLQREPALRANLMRNAHRLYDGLQAMGFQTGPEANPIVAVAMPNQEVAVTFWKMLLESGLYLNLAIPPATPTDVCLLRTSVSAAHTPQQIDTALAMFADVGRRLGFVDSERRRAGGVA